MRNLANAQTQTLTCKKGRNFGKESSELERANSFGNYRALQFFSVLNLLFIRQCYKQGSTTLSVKFKHFSFSVAVHCLQFNTAYPSCRIQHKTLSQAVY